MSKVDLVEVHSGSHSTFHVNPNEITMVVPSGDPTKVMLHLRDKKYPVHILKEDLPLLGNIRRNP